MATLDTCGEWLVTTCDKKLIAIHTKQSREPFVFDCSTAEKKPEDRETDNKSDGGGPEEPGNDKILAFAASPSGKLAALTDDSKRLILFSCDPSWQCICTRSVVRRCTSLVFSQAEDQVMAADKSGDVYSFSVTEPQKEGELKLGHLSMLLAIALTPNDKYIVTADRDEKIRVSHLKSPYNIQSFCLGHLEFVSALLIPSSHPQWLMSGSGDGTVKLWDYESGRKLDSWNMIEHGDAPSLETDKEKIYAGEPVHQWLISLKPKSAVSRIASSPDGHHIAVQCERVPTLQFLGLHQGEKEKLVPCGGMTLPHCPLDMTFDRQGRLWVLLDSSDTLLQMYTHTQDHWKCDAKSPEFNRVAEALKPHLEAFQASARAQSRFLHLYKVNFDNMASYMQRKQQRLEQQKSDSGKKRTAGDVQKAANRAASKKAREDKSEAVSQTES